MGVTKTSIAGVTRGGRAAGTKEVGSVRADYSHLRAVLGPAGKGDGFKTSTEWVVTFRDRTFTIYDYKATRLYDSDLLPVWQLRLDDAYDWHVGGHDNQELAAFLALLNAALAPYRARDAHSLKRRIKDRLIGRRHRPRR